MRTTLPMRALICGSRTWVDREAIRNLLLSFGRDTTIIHGGARGADTIAGEEADLLDLDVWRFPAQWKKFGKAAGPIRNKQMLDQGKPDVVYAFTMDLEKSRGTANMIGQARGAGVAVVIYDPSGRL